MRRILVFAAVVALVGGLWTAPSNAAVQSSKHDMDNMASILPAYAGAVGTYGLCSACHIPHKAGGDKLWKASVTPMVAYGTLGHLCNYCHGGNLSGVGADMSVTVFAAGPTNYGHKLSAATGSNILNIAGLGSATDCTAASLLPYVSGFGTTRTYMECVTCHSVHNSNNNRAFLNVQTGPPQVTGLEDICDACHPGRSKAHTAGTNNMYLNANGIHPSSPAMVPTALTANATYAPVATGTGLASDPAWNAGPHLSAAGGVYCNSCHMVHGDEGATATNAFTTIPYSVFENNRSYLLAFNAGVAGTNLSNAFCEACHRGTGGQGASTFFPNPGTSANFHPADDGINNGTGRVSIISEPLGWVFSGGASANATDNTGNLLCTTCHGIHNTAMEGTTFANSPLLRKTAPGGLNGDVGTTGYCMGCHSVASWTNRDCFHLAHYQPAADGSGGVWGTTAGQMNEGSRVTWAGAAIGVTGNLDCNACHRAHNAPYTRILRAAYSATSGAAKADAICIDCHTVNPSLYTTYGDTNNRASHFVGSPAKATAATGFSAGGFGTLSGFTLSRSAQKTNAWPNGALSLYDLDNGTLAALDANGKGAVTCLSCHTVGNSCGSNTAGTKAKTGDNFGATTSQTYMMLGPSGNQIETFGTAADRGDTVVTPPDYLCTACHGLNAFRDTTSGAAGTTHPLQTVPGLHTYTVSANFNATLTPTTSRLNCESCHRAHDAATKAGSYVLENDTADGVINSTNTVTTAVEPAHKHHRFCSGCHSNK